MHSTLHFILTGGTIDRVNDEKQYYPRHSDVQNYITQKIQPYFKTEFTIPFLKDSLSMSDADRDAVLELARSSPHSKIIVTHGSDSVIQTAQLLKRSNLDKIIVFVSAFYFLSDALSDGGFNLGFACHTALTSERGVFMSVNGRLFDPDNVRKNHALKRFEEIIPLPWGLNAKHSASGA